MTTITSGAKYSENRVFQNIDEDSIIWRYFNERKFISLIENSALFFSPCDKFSDKFEGKLPQKNIELKIFSVDSVEEEIINANRKLRMDFTADLLKLMYINCFHINDSTSDKMWKNYASFNYGIAIKTTFRNLKKCFRIREIDNRYFTEVYIGKVAYIDHGRDLIPDWTIFHPFLHKNRQYSFENELRLITTFPDLDTVVQQCDSGYKRGDEISNIWEYLGLDNLPQYEGVLISVDLDTLIDEVIVAPDVSLIYLERISKLLEANGVTKNIVRS